ncbi:MAG TPA: YlbF family regulator [Tepidisphaeraceae bacterium]|nr:YlbF family regulator [Tepidisphaeraceae bacterium]
MPSDTDQIISAAEKLGQLVSEHPAVARYKEAQKSVAQDAEASRLMGDFGKQIESLARQEQTGAAITDAQRQQLESLQARIASNLKVKAMNLAEVEFTDLLRRVSQTWQRPLAESAQASRGAPAQRP